MGLFTAQRISGPWAAGWGLSRGLPGAPGWGKSRDAQLCLPRRSFRRSDPVNPYHVGSGYVFAPAASANDSEISSDALTDDSMSMTDSSV